jgi:glutamate--cysteine ligase
MMKQSSAIQISIDYSDESDAMRKFRTAMGIVPIFYSIFANSPILSGKLNGYKSYRGHVWTDTDPQRCGILPFAFDDNLSFNSYVDYALDSGMYFVSRDGILENMTGVSFRHFLENGHNDFTATPEDWELHISTLFPEVRFKKYIEIRCFDSQPYENMLAVPAMIKGIFYDSDSLGAAWELVKDWSWEERVLAYHSVHKHALQAEIRNISFQQLASKLIQIAKKGLLRQNINNKSGQNESIYLDNIAVDVKNGICPADKLIDKWENEWKRDIIMLINHCAYKF